jgi:hypothetical protein
MINRDEIEIMFTYHPPVHDQASRYEALRAKVKYLAHEILDMTPESREQSLAITHLEQAVFYANAAIARRDP